MRNPNRGNPLNNSVDNVDYHRVCQVKRKRNKIWCWWCFSVYIQCFPVTWMILKLKVKNLESFTLPWKKTHHNYIIPSCTNFIIGICWRSCDLSIDFLERPLQHMLTNWHWYWQDRSCFLTNMINNRDLILITSIWCWSSSDALNQIHLPTCYHWPILHHWSLRKSAWWELRFIASKRQNRKEVPSPIYQLATSLILN